MQLLASSTPCTLPGQKQIISYLPKHCLQKWLPFVSSLTKVLMFHMKLSPPPNFNCLPGCRTGQWNQQVTLASRVTRQLAMHLVTFPRVLTFVTSNITWQNPLAHGMFKNRSITENETDRGGLSTAIDTLTWLDFREAVQILLTSRRAPDRW